VADQGTPAPGRAGPVGSVESLYPFLYADTGDLGAVLEEVRRSTVAKAEEIIELRRRVRDRDGERLLACAADMAGRFAAGGRLFAFGNGGSSSDAQQLVTLFLNPGPGLPPLPAYGLTNDGAVMTALCNDIGVEVLFSRPIAAFGGKHDIAVGLSTSGNSANLLRAFDEAGRRGARQPGLPVRRAVRLGAPDPGGPDHDVPRAVGTDPRAAPDGGDDVMCLGIPGELIEFVPDHPDLAKVDVSGVKRVINVGLLADDMPKPGEWVLIHVGFALSKIDEAEAAAALQFLEGIGQAYDDELAALQESRIE
jgi:D-sedoheptulose 7-phosphate isomerase